ncbi:MAG TPA: hemolysin family protein [Psychromonas sp.]
MDGNFIWIIILIFISSFFAISEISLAAARQIKLNILVDDGNEKAKLVLGLQANSGAFFAAIQIAMNAIAILGGIIGESAFTPHLKQIISYVYTGVFLHQISFTLSFLLVTSLFILFADLIPKRIGMALPEKIALRVVKPMLICVKILKPFVMLFNGLSNAILKLFGIPTERVEVVTAQEIVAMMDAGAANGSIQSQEYKLIGNVFELESRSLTSVMCVRDDIVFLNEGDTHLDISDKIVQHPHNFYLVCDNGLDQVLGLVESKDLLKQVLAGEQATLKAEIIDREIFYLPDSLSLSEALEAFKCHTQPIAVVLNEYSLVVGLVTIKDVMSIVVDGFPTTLAEQLIVKRSDTSWLIDGSASIIDVGRCLSIKKFPDSENYETLAGFIMYKLKKLPKLTDYLLFKGYRFEVVDMDKLKITKLLVSKIEI